ncbi:MAG: hypothetical protein Greene041619_741 [Candidatus Peregrinibacteria bacterium Greene0416_19]|nr:MAG: hypothetical protein Greene041619_741 [Candidatus Peregrinibacteria bacterium Greene0416_19]
METRTFIIGRDLSQDNVLPEPLSNEHLAALAENEAARRRVIALRESFLRSIANLLESGAIAANLIVKEIDPVEGSLRITGEPAQLDAINTFLRDHRLGWQAAPEETAEDRARKDAVEPQDEHTLQLADTDVPPQPDLDITFASQPDSSPGILGQLEIDPRDFFADISPDYAIDFSEAAEAAPIPGHYRITFGEPDSLQLQKQRSRDLRSPLRSINARRTAKLQQDQWEAFSLRTQQFEWDLKILSDERVKALGEHPEQPSLAVVLRSPATFSVIVRGKLHIIQDLLQKYGGTGFIAKVEEFRPQGVEVRAEEIQHLLQPPALRIIDEMKWGWEARRRGNEDTGGQRTG